MGVYPTAWAGPVFVEAMRFWFYSLVCSILLLAIELWTLSTTPTKSTDTNSEKENEVDGQKDTKTNGEQKTRLESGRTKRVLIKKLVADIADLFIPGTITGWLSTSTAGVGWAGLLSTVLSGAEVWQKVQNQKT